MGRRLPRFYPGQKPPCGKNFWPASGPGPAWVLIAYHVVVNFRARLATGRWGPGDCNAVVCRPVNSSLRPAFCWGTSFSGQPSAGEPFFYATQIFPKMLPSTGRPVDARLKVGDFDPFFFPLPKFFPPKCYAVAQARGPG